MSKWWPLIRLIPVKTNFVYVKFAGFAAFMSIALLIGSVASWATAGFTKTPAEIVASGGPTLGSQAQNYFCNAFNCGVDFKGGSLLEVTTKGPVPLAQLRATMDELNLGDVQVQEFGRPESALVRFETPEGQNPAVFVDQVKADLRQAFPGIEFARAEVVGPKVSGELFSQGLLALGLAIGLMLIYIWFRFELNYAVGAVLALFHDLLLTMGLISVLRMEFSLTTIAALLTIIGYSMNDTVVVYDRMRENRRKLKRMPWSELIDLSLNETLSRTIITGGTALLALGGLMVVGGPAMWDFSFIMIFGIVVGTYSSIYVAAPALMLLGGKLPATDKEAGETAGDIEAASRP
jgi:preprotein translocase SecF subunit